MSIVRDSAPGRQVMIAVEIPSRLSSSSVCPASASSSSSAATKLSSSSSSASIASSSSSVRKTKRRRRNSSDSEDSDEDGSGAYRSTARRTRESSSESSIARRVRSGDARPTNTPLHAYASLREMNARLVKLSASASWQLIERVVSYQTAASKTLWAAYEDADKCLTEPQTKPYFAWSAAIKAAMFIGETTKRNGVVKGITRHAWVGMAVRVGADGSKILLIWDGDAQERWAEAASQEGGDAGKLYLSHLSAQMGRFVDICGGVKSRKTLAVYYGGFGNERQEKCLEVARLFLTRCAREYIQDGELDLTDAFLERERFRKITSRHL